MKNGICYVVGAGENYGIDFVPTENDYVIAVDGGLKYLEEAGFSPNLIIGDFDSLGFSPDQQDVIWLDTEKDDTDMFAAVKEGLKAGLSSFHIYCGMGGRFDHSLANLQLLAYLSAENKQGFLYGKDCVVTAITNTTFELQEDYSGYISVFSYSEKSEGVTLRGLKYKLDNATIESTLPIGVSNECTGHKSSITVENGTLIIVFPLQNGGGKLL